MSGKWIGAVVLATAAAYSTPGLAQSVKNDNKTALEREQTALSAQIDAKQQQLATLRGRPLPEQAELQEAQKRVNDARSAWQKKNNPDTEAKLKNAEFKYTLAERRFNKANAEIDGLNAEVEQLRQQLGAKQQPIKTLGASANEATASTQQRQTEERARRQEQELLRTRQEAESQQREIERLKALLAAREAASAKTVVSTAAVSTATTSSPQNPSQSTAPVSADFHRVNSSQDVLRELQQLEQRLAGISTHARGGVNEALYLKTVGGQATNKDKVTLRALGLEQYRGEAQIEPGNYELVVGLNRWPLQLGDNDSGTFVFLYDHRDAQKPRLVFYNRALEGKSGS